MKLKMNGWQRSLLAAVTVLAATMTFMVPASAAGDAAAGAKKVYTCLGCHGVKHYVNTYPTYHVPRLAGQHEAYLVAALNAYRSKARPHVTMQANAGSLTDQDIADIAAYFSTQGEKDPGTKPSDKAVKSADAAGATVCSGCHAADGNSTLATNPKLAGQYASYIEQALKAYRSGERQNPIMSGFAQGLDDAQIKALAAHFAAQEQRLFTVTYK